MEKMPYLVAVDTSGTFNDAEAEVRTEGQRVIVGYAYTGGVRGSMEKHAFDEKGV